MKISGRLLLPVLVLVNALVLTLAGRAGEGDGAPRELAEVQRRADAALARTELTAYRGWIKFLRFEAEAAVAKSGAASEVARAKTERLASWVDRISADPQLLSKLEGVQEWAYESPVDGSGQPFKMAIPTDYDPARPVPLSVYMHGYAGNHLEHSTGMAAQAGMMDVAVLGRARGGGYRALSEADVLHVIDYLQAHWAIDADRIHLSGGSMGGGGTFRLGARYPHRFASGRPTCGFLGHLPVGNLKTFPLYATHSADDPVVSVLHARGGLARLREAGGRAILDETNGLGHAAWDYREGNERGAAWVRHQVRPASRTVRHIDYTATDGNAMRGWWGEIAEWGPAMRAARFVLTAGAGNLLHAELTNVAALRLRLAESPFDADRPLAVSVNGGAPLTWPAPLPATLVVERAGEGWKLAADTPRPGLRTPGAAMLLYNGDPLLIVYGTGGDDAMRQALRRAATAASKSPNPTWLDDGGGAAPDGMPHSHNLYGRLTMKADTEVTDADLARCHLVLIGTAAQNAVVARMADRLPVRFAGGTVTCSDGLALAEPNQALGLVHANPLAAGGRLVFWVASENPAAYAPNAFVPTIMGGGNFIAAPLYGADLLVADATSGRLVAARRFDSRWRWTDDRAASAPVPEKLRTHSQLAEAMGAALRRGADAEVALVTLFGPADEAAVTAGVTRVSDVLPRYYQLPVGVMDLTGAELAEIARKAGPAREGGLIIDRGTAAGRPLEKERVYRVALPVDLLWIFGGVAELAPGSYRQTDVLLGDAMERYLGTE